MINLNFSTYPSTTGLIPVGSYYVKIIEINNHISQKNGNKTLAIQMEITGDSYVGRKLTEYLGIYNQNSEFKKLANDKLNDIVIACAKDEINFAEDLLNIPFKVYIGQSTDKSNGKIRNKIYNYSIIEQKAINNNNSVKEEIDNVKHAIDVAFNGKKNTNDDIELTDDVIPF